MVVIVVFVLRKPGFVKYVSQFHAWDAIGSVHSVATCMKLSGNVHCICFHHLTKFHEDLREGSRERSAQAPRNPGNVPGVWRR